MTRVRYFRYATLLPVVVPIVLTALACLALLVDMRPEGLFIATPILLSGALVLGPGYLILAGFSLMFLRRRSQGWYVAVGLLSPLILAASIPLALLLCGVSLHDSIDQWRSLARWCYIVGYFYVAIAFAGLFCLTKAGLVD